MLMIAGIVIAVAGLEGVVTNVVRPVPSATAWRLGAGVAVYLAGDAFFRHVLQLGSLRARLVAATLAIATAPVGLAVGYVAQLALLVLLLAGMLTFERWRRATLTKTRPDRGAARASDP